MAHLKWHTSELVLLRRLWFSHVTLKIKVNWNMTPCQLVSSWRSRQKTLLKHRQGVVFYKTWVFVCVVLLRCNLGYKIVYLHWSPFRSVKQFVCNMRFNGADVIESIWRGWDLNARTVTFVLLIWKRGNSRDEFYDFVQQIYGNLL